MVVFYVFMLINILIFLCSTGLASSGDYLIKEWKCVNPECTVPISEAETDISYNSPDHHLKLTFKAGEQVAVLRKPAENEKEQSLWWISLNGKEGYVTKEFIKEKKILNLGLVHARKIEDPDPISISPTPAYEVSDGTTIFSEFVAEGYNGDKHYRYDFSVAGYNVDKNADQIESKEENKIEQVSKKPNIILNGIVNVNSTISKLTKTNVEADSSRTEHIEFDKYDELNTEVDKLDISIETSDKSDVELGSSNDADTSANRGAEHDHSSKWNDKSDTLDNIYTQVDTSANTIAELDQSSKSEVEIDKHSKLEKDSLSPTLDNQAISENVANSKAINNYLFDPLSNLSSKTNFLSEEIFYLSNTGAKLRGNERSDSSHLEPQYGIDSAKEKPIIKDTEENPLEENMSAVQSVSLATNSKDIRIKDVKGESVLLNQNPYENSSDILNNNSSLDVEVHLLDNKTSSSQDINQHTMSNHEQLSQTQTKKEELVVSEKDFGSNDSLLAGQNSSSSRLDFENEKRHSSNDASDVSKQEVVPPSELSDAMDEVRKATESVLSNTGAKLGGNVRSDTSHLEPQYGIDSAKEKPIIKDTEENPLEENMSAVQSVSLATNSKDIRIKDVKGESVLLNQNPYENSSDILNNNSSLDVEVHLLDNKTSSSQDINQHTMSNHEQLSQTQTKKEELVVSEKDFGSNDSLLAGQNSSSSRLDFENETRYSNNDANDVSKQEVVPPSEESDAMDEVRKATESAENIVNHSFGDQNSVIDQQPLEVVTEIAKFPPFDSTVTSKHADGDVTSSDYSLNNDLSLPQTTTEFSEIPASECIITTEVQSGHLCDLHDREDESLKENKFSEPNQNSYKLGNTAMNQDEGTRTILHDENFQNSSQKWFSSLYSIMETLQKLYLSSLGKSNTPEPETTSTLINEPQIVSVQECDGERTADSPNEYCKQEQNIESLLSLQDSTNSEPEQFKEGGESIWSFRSTLWLVGSSLVILCFSLGYYYLDNVRRDGELVQKNNALASELFILEREKAILDEDFVLLKGNVQSLIEEKCILINRLLTVEETLQKTKEEKIIIEEKESKLIKKLMMVEQNYNELRKIFSESKQKAERATLISDIKKLKDSIAADNIEISSLKDELLDKKNEIKSLNSSLQRSQEAKIALEEQIGRMVVEGQERAREYQVTLAKMEQTIEENKVIQSKIEVDLRKQMKECESLIIQKELAESALQKAHGITSTESLADWHEIKEVRISLLAAEKEIVKLNQERDNLLESLESAQGKNRSLTSEVEKLNEKYENGEKEKIDALTKLQVLSNYFKEKEIQLQEELGMKEAQWLQKQSDNSTIYQQMRDLREENVNLKGLVETLKKEILGQEASYKKIINTTEQKAHENWVCYRRTEVRLKEVQAEAAQLRNRLTTLETCDDNPEDKLHKSIGGLEVNGDLPGLGSAISPPFMLYPNEFIPPPPLLPPTAGSNTASRPPPLGRISSPPLVSGDFIPPPPLLPPYEVFSHGHTSPPSPPPPLLHKPQPREYHHITQSQPPSASKQKDSLSSNHSSDSPHDKTPARRGKR